MHAHQHLWDAKAQGRSRARNINMPKPSTHRLEELTTSTWEEDNTASRRSSTPPSRRRSPSPPTAPPSAPGTTPTPREEEEEQCTNLQPKRRRLDRTNGKGLAKHATRTVVTLTSESHEEVVFSGDTVRCRGVACPKA